MKILFNLHEYERLEIDLVHINKNGRSSFTVDDIVKIFDSLVANMKLEPIDLKYFNDESCAYFKHLGFYESKKYKVVFCVCSDMPDAIGIITLHRA